MATTKSIPEVEVYARPFGYLQWVCPSCHEIFGAKQISGRRARIVCTHCARVYRLGLGFRQTIVNLPPFNAEYGQTWNGYTANRLNHPKAHLVGIARFRGRIDWACPTCRTIYSSSVGRDLMEVRCNLCNLEFYLYMIFYQSRPGSPIRCPLDWSLPYAAHESSLDPVAAAETRQIS